MNILKPNVQELKLKAEKTEVGAILYRTAMENANEVLKRIFPKEPLCFGYYVQKIDDMYTDEYLTALQAYDDISWMYENAFTVLAFAYLMTGDDRYLSKWIEAVDACFINEYWGPRENEYDHCSSRLLRSLSISATWIYEQLPHYVKEKIDARLLKEINGFIKKYERAGDLYPLGPNGHQWKDIAGAGIACWFLSSRHPEVETYFERFLMFYENKIIEESIGPDGGWLDGVEIALYVLLDAIFWFEVVKEHKGRDISKNPLLIKACDNIIGTIPLHKGYKYPYSNTLFWLAANYRRKDLQYLAVTGVLTGQSDTRFNAYSLIFYDHTLEPEESDKSVIFFKDVGWGRLGRGLNQESVYLWMKCGPTDAFYRNNQNGLLLTAYGRNLFSDVRLLNVGYRKLWNTVYNKGLWTTKCSTSLLVNWENQKLNKYGEDWAPIMKFHRPDRPKWGDVNAWWFDFTKPKAPYGRFIGAIDYGNYMYMAGRADTAYGDLINSYTRECCMTDDGIIVIVDRIKPGKKAKSFQFRACTDWTFELRNDNVIVDAVDAGAVINFLYNGKKKVTVGTWDFQPDFGMNLTADCEISGDNALLVTVICPYRGTKQYAPQVASVLSSDGTRLTVECGGKFYEFKLADSCAEQLAGIKRV